MLDKMFTQENTNANQTETKKKRPNLKLRALIKTRSRRYQTLLIKNSVLHELRGRRVSRV